jgi:hypothetical protein
LFQFVADVFADVFADCFVSVSGLVLTLDNGSNDVFAMPRFESDPRIDHGGRVNDKSG